MSVVSRSTALLAAPLMVIGSSALAQAPAPVAPTTRCLVGSTALRTVTGGVLGGWLGLVAHKIQVSDWNDVSHTAEGHRALNRSMFTGAAIGAVLGAVIHVGKPCSGSVASDNKPRIGREPLYAAEIQKSGVTGTVYDALLALRRNWLNLRGTDALTEGAETFTFDGGQQITITGEPRLIVYLDNAKLGGVDQLKTLALTSISSVRFFDGPEATYRWGAGTSHGVIQVLTSEQ